MRRAWITAGLWVAMLCALCARGEPNTAVELPPRDRFHLYLLAGQSNMAGRGKVAPEDKVIHPRVFALSKSGDWVPAADPIHYDKGAAGVGPGKAFALVLAERNPDIAIGLIPAACGGSPISSWVPGGFHNQTRSHPYDDAVARARRAMRDGVLKGILWHQGESDCSPEKAAVYKQELVELIERFRKDLAAPDLPFIIGQLGQFDGRPWSEARKTVDAAQRTVAREVPFAGFVSSDELGSNPDKVHFSAESQRTFGRRYADVYRKVSETPKH